MLDKLLNVVARLLMAQIFIISGVGKITGYGATQQYMNSMGVPGALLPLVILVELGGGIALLLGFKTRWAATALCLFTLAAAALFHRNFADQMQMIHFMKDLAIAGGLLMFARHGAGQPSLDREFGTAPASYERL